MWRVGKSLMSSAIPPNADRRVHLARADEPVRDAALVEHLDRARVQTAGTRAVEILVGASLDDDDVDPRQRQLGRQHQPGRATARDDHRMVGRRRIATTVFATHREARSQLDRPRPGGRVVDLRLTWLRRESFRRVGGPAEPTPSEHPPRAHGAATRSTHPRGAAAADILRRCSAPA